MNRSILYTIALAFVMNVIAVRSETVTDAENPTVDSTVDTGEEIEYDANDLTKKQEEKLTESVGDMIEYFTKSITDMSNILEDIKNVGENNGENIRMNLVDNLMNYVEDSEIMKQQITRVMALRAQFQDSILQQLYSLPISAEDAEKLESDLREQIQFRADKIPSMANIMNFQ